jgi:pimeloyl-ACP methyl ester carboxylesterase
MDLPGHGGSARFADPADYSAPGYAAVVAGFLAELDASDAVLVGWSLGGHIVLDSVPLLSNVPGYLIMGTPPISGPAQLGEAFLPNPAFNVGFTADVSRDDALRYARAALAPGSTLPRDAQVADILATDPTARSGLAESVGQGRLADEIGIVADLTRPLAVLHGHGDQLISLDYLRTLRMPTLWRGAVQVIDGAGHSPQEENPDAFSALLSEFLSDVSAG